MKAVERRDLSWGIMARCMGLAALSVVALLGLTWVIASRLASREVTRAERRVVARRVEVDALPPPRPPRVMSAEARQAVVDAAESAGPLDGRAPLPRDLMDTRWQEVQLWLARQLAAPRESVDEPPPSVRALTEERRPALERMLVALDEADGVVGGELPPQLHGAAGALLLDALVLEHDGREAEAAARVEAAWDLAEGRLEQAPLGMRWESSRDLQHALIAARKVPVPMSRASSLDVAALRTRAARAASARAGELVVVAKQGSADELFAEWRVEPTWTRRLLAPLYRRRLASSSALLAERGASLARDLSAESDDARQARLQAYSLPPLTSASPTVHELAVGMSLADLTESRWDAVSFEEAEAARDLHFVVEDWEITRRVLLLRARRDASPDGAWPGDMGDLAASDYPWLRITSSAPEPGGIRLTIRSDLRMAGEQRVVFESAPR